MVSGLLEVNHDVIAFDSGLERRLTVREIGFETEHVIATNTVAAPRSEVFRGGTEPPFLSSYHSGQPPNADFGRILVERVVRLDFVSRRSPERICAAHWRSESGKELLHKREPRSRRLDQLFYSISLQKPV